jgi:hypothetical protein
MSFSLIDGNLTVRGALSSESLSIPALTVTDAMVSATAGISAAKLEHEFRPTYAQEASANNAAETRVVWTARAAGVVQAFEVGLVTPPDTASGSGGRTAIVDLKKNGTTILSATVTLNSTTVAYALSTATISSSAYVDGDVFTVVVTAGVGTTGTYPKGVFAAMTVREAAA